MKKFLLYAFLIFGWVQSRSQQLHAIRFIHRGDELKPIGTLVISVEQKVQPNDKPLDSIFGRSFKTDIKTYKTIDRLIKNKKYKLSGASDNLDFYQVRDSNGFELFLDHQKYKLFFGDLRFTLKRKNCDSVVIQAFKYY